MYDKELLESVANATCDYAALRKNYPRADMIEYDEDHSFEKYYHLESIIASIEKYQKGEITDDELAHWACVYDYVLNGRFVENDEDDIPIELFILRYEVSDWLDSLSFFEECEDSAKHEDGVFDLEERKEGFRVLDRIMRTHREWVFYYDDLYDDYQELLLVNESRRAYVRMVSDFFDGDAHGLEKSDSLREMREKLRAEGYEEWVICSFWTEMDK